MCAPCSVPGWGRSQGHGPLWERPTQDLGVPDDRADLPERLLSGLLHFDMGVGQHFRELGHDVGQTGRQLLGSTVRHCPEQLHRSCRQHRITRHRPTVTWAGRLTETSSLLLYRLHSRRPRAEGRGQRGPAPADTRAGETGLVLAMLHGQFTQLSFSGLSPHPQVRKLT